MWEMEASHWASSVVGKWMRPMPRCRVEAMKPQMFAEGERVSVVVGGEGECGSGRARARARTGVLAVHLRAWNCTQV